MRSLYFDASIPRVLLTMGFKKVWKKAIFAPTSPVRFSKLPEPELPGPRWIKVRNRVCGICASDLHLIEVDVDPLIHPAALPAFSRIYLGHEAVGEVIEVGPDVTTLRPGDRVLMKSRFLGPTCHSQEIEPICPSCASGNYALCENQSRGVGPRGVGGGFSDLYTCHETEVWKVPADLDDETAALIEPLSCSVRAVLRRPPRNKEKVLVLGCGMIGLGVVAAIRALYPEAEIYAAARYPQQKERATRLGAQLIEGDPFMATARITGAQVFTGEFGNRTALGGFDVVYDCVGTGETIATSLRISRAGGTVVVVGVHLHRMKTDLTPLWHQEVNLIGAYAHGTELVNGKPILTYELTADLLRNRKIPAQGWVTHRFPLERWQEAITTARDKTLGSIKVMFVWDRGSLRS